MNWAARARGVQGWMHAPLVGLAGDGPTRPPPLTLAPSRRPHLAPPAPLQGNQLTTAWVGDSRGVLGRRCPESGAWQALDLTYDHKPTAAGEKERILRSQGRVER